MARVIFMMAAVFVCAGLAHAGFRVDLSGDAVVDFKTTMDMPFMTVGNPGNAGELGGGKATGDTVLTHRQAGRPRSLSWSNQ